MAELISDKPSVVLLGSLNPQIFQPSWFARHELLRPGEADIAPVEVIHQELSKFTTEWVEIQVTRDRFMAIAADPRYVEALRDLVMGTFTVLRHSPVRAIGFNRTIHYRMDDEAAWHALGDRIMPKDIWKPLLDQSVRPGMISAIVQGTPRGRPGARLQVRVHSAEALGVIFAINEHYDTTGAQDAGASLERLQEHWIPAQQYASEIAASVIREAGNGR